MKEWTFDQIVLSPGGAKHDLELRKAEIEALRAENDKLRAGINEITELKVATLGAIKKKCAALLDEGGA